MLKPNHFRYSCLLFFITLCNVLCAQNITGRVIDSASSRPISNASVYLNGSSTGTMTDQDGQFILHAKTTNIPLIISCVGYESETITKYGSQPLTVKLAHKAMVLKEVTINVGGMSREKQLAIFLREFLGTPAHGCTITNTDDLTFHYSQKANRLTAESDRPLQIVNKTTGYQLTYFLSSFVYTDTLIYIRGNYFFKEDTAGLNSAEIRKVLKTRENYYLGSKMHFFRALWNGNLKQEGYSLSERLSYDDIPAGNVVVTNHSKKYFAFKRPINIIYRNNRGKPSVIGLVTGKTSSFFDSDGFYDPDVYWSGNMATQRMAQLLPFEYWPPGKSRPGAINYQTERQPRFDSLLNLYTAKHRSPVLFMHFDKDVYSNNENVWFTGYLVGNEDYSPYTTLSLMLVKDDDRSILMDDRFVINNGFCFGNTVIPDSVRAGAYTMVAYGNRLENNMPDVIFKQRITIKTGDQPSFNASLNPLDTAASAANQKIMLLVTFANAQSAPNTVPVAYYVGNAKKPVTGGAVKTSSGQYIFNIPSNLLTPANNQLHVQVKYKTEVQDLSIKLPVPPQPANVRFYPEGGNMVNGVVNTMGWEAKNAAGAPLYVQGVLYEDGHVMDTVRTNSNGMGRFLIIPNTGKKYSVKLIGTNTNTAYSLPSVATGAALSVKHAIVNDTLLVDVYNDNPKRKLYLVGHNYRQSFFEAAVVKRPNQRVKVILSDVPRGILQLTLVDSLGQPFAERMVFAHYNNPSRLDIKTDNNSYNNRKKVKLNIKLTGEADSAAISVAVVQENRIEIKNRTDIESYLYLNSNLDDLPVKENYFSNGDFDKRDLENILLIKGWSRYKWTDVLKASKADSLQKSKELAFTGKVTKYAGKFKKPVPLVTLNPTHTYETDINGSFSLPDSSIIHQPGKKISIMVANGSPAEYKIQLLNPYDTVNKRLAVSIEPLIDHSSDQESSASLQVPGTERAIQLKEVVIKDNKINSSFYTTMGEPNACGDYVCPFQILNCPNHRNDLHNTQPVAGKIYRNGINGATMVVYAGCNMEVKPNITGFKGIYAAQEFYPADYGEVNPSQPDYVSTLFWKNQLILKKDEAHKLSFYTSDINGPYKVIIQGVTNTGVIYGETSFKVNK